MTEKRNALNIEEMDKVSGGDFIDDIVHEATKEPTKRPAGEDRSLSIGNGLFSPPEIDLNSPFMRPGGYHPDRELERAGIPLR